MCDRAGVSARAGATASKMATRGYSHVLVLIRLVSVNGFHLPFLQEYRQRVKIQAPSLRLLVVAASRRCGRRRGSVYARGRRCGGVSAASCIYFAKEIRIEHNWLFEITIGTQEFTDGIVYLTLTLKLVTK